MDGPAARAIIEKGLQLGLAQFCIHKGLQIGSFFIPEFNYPDDIGVVAKDYPTAKFVIYHSAICAGHQNCSTAPPEGPYDAVSPRPSGLNALIRSLADNGIGPEAGQRPNTNVYGEVGSAINEVMASPTEAAHFFGKLMKYLGTDNVVWGTDCIIYGSPQRFIDWFRALTIPQSMQDQYGYPPLDATNKAKILGLNAAKLYGLDPVATRCQVRASASYKLKQQLDEELGERRWAFQKPAGPQTRAEFIEHYRLCNALGRPG
jgi:predicted TIM-barrel fold metal-dependent hydrolase